VFASIILFRPVERRGNPTTSNNNNKSIGERCMRDIDKKKNSIKQGKFNEGTTAKNHDKSLGSIFQHLLYTMLYFCVYISAPGPERKTRH
jgi:hypothetical protein